jgi:hypothetical protein
MRAVPVRFATRRGAEERSYNPLSPSARYLLTHLRAQRTLTPAPCAALASVAPSTTTCLTNRRLPLQLRAALR